MGPGPRSPTERVPAELHRAELLTRPGRHAPARAALAQAEALVDAAEKEGAAEYLAAAREVVAGGESGASPGDWRRQRGG